MIIRCILFASVMLAAPAGAQEKIVAKKVTALSGQDTRVVVFGCVTPQCTNGKATIAVAQKPRNGTLTSKPAKMRAGTIPRCPALEAKVAAFFYRPKDGFSGTDQIVFVVISDSGRVERHQFVIDVPRVL